MKFKRNRWLLLFVLLLALLCAGAVAAHNKVVVIPLMEDTPPLEPWAPVTSVSPSAYFTAPTTVVIDMVTGLIWQKSDDNITRTWEDAWDYCRRNTPELPGTGWRLPADDELMSIVHYGNDDPAINKTAFPGTHLSYYWSATTAAYHSANAWHVDFGDGSVRFRGKVYSSYVRCVRMLPNRMSLFKNNGNGTVTDLATGLTWQREDDGNVTRKWAEASSYCQGLPLAGGGWRLPTIKELRSIVDERLWGLAIDSFVFPGNSYWRAYWSSTTYSKFSNEAWLVHFEDGGTDHYDKSGPGTVRCVR